MFLGEPTSCYKIIGDGNSLFRSVALAVSGNELHRYFRNIITSFIEKNQKHLVNNETSEDYLNRTQMRENGVWGTDIELYFAAKFLNCSIFVYSKHGQSYDWLEFKPEIKTEKLAIYLNHKNSDHYDVVTSVKRNDLFTEKNELQQEQFLSIDFENQSEKDETQFDISMVSY